jgi:hypothetical protein
VIYGSKLQANGQKDRKFTARRPCQFRHIGKGQQSAQDNDGFTWSQHQKRFAARLAQRNLWVMYGDEQIFSDR